MESIEGILVIGASRGGTQALAPILASLPRSYPVPIAIVQHRPPTPQTLLAEMLASSCPLPLGEPMGGEVVRPGRVYLAPADHHLVTEDGRWGITSDDPVQYCRPSVDVLFTSAAQDYQDRTVGLVLTGANADGAEGLARIHVCGGLCLIQDPETAEAQAMPRAAQDRVPGAQILTLDRIGPFLASLARRHRPWNPGVD